jgi:predicted alpha/beta superfamily hydrolase
MNHSAWRTATIRFLVAFLVLGNAAGLRAAEDAAQSPPFPMPGTEVHRLISTQNGVDYELRVWLPHGYDEGENSYALTVLLDADYQFPLAVSILEHLAERGQADESIIVAIGYKDSARNPDGYRRNRTRDYTPTVVASGGYGPQYQRYSGGAPAFLTFVTDEMMPFLVTHYRISAESRTFVGNSFGGLFGAYVLSDAADLFSSYILISPSMWYDDRLLIKMARKEAPGELTQPVKLFLAVGGHENQSGHPMVDELELYAAALRAQEQTQLQLTVRVFENETHASIYPIALSAALRHLRTR